jgi:hypothetical protein
VKKCTSGAACAIDNLLVELLEILAVVRGGIRDNIHQAAPAPTESHDAIPFVQGAERNRADGGIQAGNVASAR